MRYGISRQQKLIINLAAKHRGYHLLTKEWILENIALMYEFSSTDETVRSAIAETYAIVKNMPDEIWRETEPLIPFPVI